jgi:integrase
MKTPDLHHLWDRGRQSKQQNWYLRLPIPKALRQHTAFGGKLSIVRPLDTGDLAVARRRRDALVVGYRRIFDRMLAGEEMTADQIKDAVSLDLESMTEYFKTRELQHEIQRYRRLAAQSSFSSYKGENWTIEYEPTAAIERAAKEAGIPLPLNPDMYKMIKAALESGYKAAYETALTRLDAPPEPSPETISQAAEAWFSEMQSDASAAPKQTTLDGHRLRVRALIKHCGDTPLAKVTPAMASDFLTKIAATGLSNRTVNNYATTLAGLYKSARKRGRFTGENPFEDQKRKVGGDSYVPFEIPELQTLIDSFQFEMKPKQHSPATALPWVSLIATFTGMRLEEICQLNASDIRDQSANGATVTVIDIHNGENNNLKNESSVRLVPVHSELVRAGLLRYRDSLPKGSPLFPGLTRRESKGGKIGARLGELFSKKLRALGIKRKGLCFHSLRHNVSGSLETAAVSQTDAARVLGHKIAGESYGTYSTGPGLKRLAGVIEDINYPGLVILAPET